LSQTIEVGHFLPTLFNVMISLVILEKPMVTLENALIEIKGRRNCNI